MNLASKLSDQTSLTRRDRVRSIARSFAQPVTYLGVLMLVFIYCALPYLIVADRRSAESEAANRGGNLVRILDQAFSRVFQSADASLLFLRKAYQQNPSTFDIAAWARDTSVDDELILNFIIVDANGRVVDASSLRDIVGIDVSDRAYFRDQINPAADKLFIGEPVILKVAGNKAIVLSRRLTASNGKFAGVVAVSLMPSEMIRRTGAIDLGPDGSIALTGLDGVVRARTVNGAIDWQNIGRKVPLTKISLGRALNANSGQYWSVPGVFNNVRREVSFRVLKSFPLIALVTISEAEVYRRANENARVYWVIALSLTAVTLSVCPGTI